LCATFRGEVMRQVWVWATICIRNTTNTYSNQAQIAGEVMALTQLW
jgi:hypothetical protein